MLTGSPADKDGRIRKGDRILSINGKSMKGITHRESLAILKVNTKTIYFIYNTNIQRYVVILNFD